MRPALVVLASSLVITTNRTQVIGNRYYNSFSLRANLIRGCTPSANCYCLTLLLRLQSAVVGHIVIIPSHCNNSCHSICFLPLLNRSKEDRWVKYIASKKSWSKRSAISWGASFRKSLIS